MKVRLEVDDLLRTRSWSKLAGKGDETALHSQVATYDAGCMTTRKLWEVLSKQYWWQDFVSKRLVICCTSLGT